MFKVSNVLNQPRAYLVWQGLFSGQKLTPYLNFSERLQPSRILELGCGPGTHFSLLRYQSQYVGIDLNQSYIKHAQRRHPSGRFIVGDATRLPSNLGEFDCVLINSLLHHLDDAQVENTLNGSLRHLVPGGHLHILEPIMPVTLGLSRALAYLDRGKFIRTKEEWLALIERLVAPLVQEKYWLRALGYNCYHMLYLRWQKQG